MDYEVFPGYELIREGLRDLAENRESVQSMLVLIGAPRLRRLGIDVPNSAIGDPELRLYEILSAEDPNSAHSRYNALIRRLVSFERAAECAA